MIHPDIHAMLVRERSATLLAAAAAYRRGRQARSAATAASGAAADRTAPTMSERFRLPRFLGRKRTLNEADLRFFADVDHHDREAPGALDHVRGGGVAHRGSGIAEYEIDLDGTSSRAG